MFMNRTNGQSGVLRRSLASLIALALSAAGLVAFATPAGAVHNAPWRFTTVTLNSQISGRGGAEPIKGWVLQYPSGYTPVSGGIVGGDATDRIYRLLEYPSPFDGTYHIAAGNGAVSGTTVRLAATCVWLDDVGTITTVTAEFARNSRGYAGGTLRCPDGTTVLSGGVDWSSTSDRDIDFSSPITDGTSKATGWYVAGFSGVSGVLAIELRCVASSLLEGEYVEADDSTATSGSSASAKAQCAVGYRLLIGGGAPTNPNPAVSQGVTSLSGPLDARQWTARAYGEGMVLRAIGICVPASSPSLTWGQLPPALSTASSGSITFAAADATGEQVVSSCSLDSAPRVCASGYPVNYGPLVDGTHFFSVTVQNESGASSVFRISWVIDATAPTVSSYTPTAAAPLIGPLTINFSEAVEDVSASSVIVHAERANVDIAGKIARPSTTTATWTPNVVLVPGETYRVSLTGTIHDTAGNALSPTYFEVRSNAIVENTSNGLQRSWDVDNAPIASGGAYIVSSLSGSRAEVTFTATAGQTVSVYGIRMPGGGNADVYLDGVKKATTSFYASTAARARVYLSAALNAGAHTISIRPLGTKPAGSTNSWVAVDNVAIGATVKQESALKQSFRLVSSANAYGGSYDTMTQSPAGDTTPARVQLTLVGTGAKLYVTKTPDSGQARVYLDRVLKATINLKTASTAYKALVYSTTFALGQHVLRIEAVGTGTGANSSVHLDRITID